MNQMQDHISSTRLSFDFNRNGGNIANFQITAANSEIIRPLHAAPWLANPASLPETTDLVERQLEGDFFCAPFGAKSGRPIHGWTANGHWQRQSTTPKDSHTSRISYRLEQPVQGATVTKHFTLVDGHPFLYQSHEFSGGSGHLPIAHHAMIHVPGGARLSFSKKQFGATPAQPLESDPERGNSMLAYPQRFETLQEVCDRHGEKVDARYYPFSHNHEDMLVLAEENAAELGWSAALAARDGFLFFAIKDARTLPETLLWISNGGRNYPPWSGRHTAVLGMEEAATNCHHTGSFGSSTHPSPDGLACGLNLRTDKTSHIRYGFGAIPAPQGWTGITEIKLSKTQLTLEDESGSSIELPFHGAHFGL